MAAARPATSPGGSSCLSSSRSSSAVVVWLFVCSSSSAAAAVKTAVASMLHRSVFFQSSSLVMNFFIFFFRSSEAQGQPQMVESVVSAPMAVSQSDSLSNANSMLPLMKPSSGSDTLMTNRPPAYEQPPTYNTHLEVKKKIFFFAHILFALSLTLFLTARTDHKTCPPRSRPATRLIRSP